jgi:16S rRNA (adenine1518-N6/adenine1519-N6)-dimethyltransferase
VTIIPRSKPMLEPHEEVGFRKFVQAIFGMRRKQILRVVRELAIPDPEVAGQVLADLGLAPTVRPEVISPGDFVRLFRLTTASRGGAE